MKGRNGPTTFLPLSPEIGGLINNNKPTIGKYLRRQQANFVYKKTESCEMINTETLQQELEHERQLNKIDDTNGDTNPYVTCSLTNCRKSTLVFILCTPICILWVQLSYTMVSSCSRICVKMCLYMHR